MGSVEFPGNMIASTFSNFIGAADTMLNGITATTIIDFIRDVLGKHLTGTQLDSIMKYVCPGYGLLSMGLTYFMTDLDSSLQTFFGIVTVTGGIGIGASNLEAFFPWVNLKGVIGGATSSLAYLAWVTFAGLLADGYSDPERFFSANVGINNETLVIPTESVEEIISGCAAHYIWHTGMSIIIFIITGILISELTDFQDPKDFVQNFLLPSPKWLFNHLPSKLRKAFNLLCYKMKVMEHIEQKR
ncbi:hypothetical protein J437_LFUL016933 [Ladona fulva]|uniref:Uncharacterized protein n=1 Tax=Ladona fulva TaxID=123851 RepID=A0A8K0KQE6_LADFU|nr:hypothetical protein J437_LFUL016933 [Ladona fulva]